MEVISNTEFGGERPLFESHNLRLENVVIRAGESAIKECSNIEAIDCRFEGTTFLHVHGFVIDRCFFDIGGRSALWYSDHLKMTDTRIDAPKMFREMHDIEIENVEIKDRRRSVLALQEFGHQKSETAWRNLSVHVQQRHPHRRIGKRQQVRFPVCEECGVAQCQNHYEGCLLGGGECDDLRFRTQR